MVISNKFSPFGVIDLVGSSINGGVHFKLSNCYPPHQESTPTFPSLEAYRRITSPITKPPITKLVDLEVVSRIQPYENKDLKFAPSNDLAPLENIKPILNQCLNYLNSPEVGAAVLKSSTLAIILSRLKTSIFHLNLQPEMDVRNRPSYATLDNTYPYDPVYEKPFPKRPSLEVLDEMKRFITYVQLVAGIPHSNESEQLIDDINTCEPYKNFKIELEVRIADSFRREQNYQHPLQNKEIIDNPVDAYLIFHQRIREYGEIASFPEFASAVDACLETLMTDTDIQLFASRDPVFNAEVKIVIEGLLQLMGQDRDK